MYQFMGARLMKWLAIGALSAVSAASAAAWAEGDAAAGHKKNHSCTGCHGIPGWRTAYPEVYKVPKLGGQGAPYIVPCLRSPDLYAFRAATIYGAPWPPSFGTLYTSGYAVRQPGIPWQPVQL